MGGENEYIELLSECLILFLHTTKHAPTGLFQEATVRWWLASGCPKSSMLV